MTYEPTGRIARITLDRPERGNGITLEMPRELAACVERANLDPEVHVIALAGNGTGFCGGYDLGFAEQLPATSSASPPGVRASSRAASGERRAARRSTPRWSAANHDPEHDLGPGHRLPDDEPQRARLHEPVPVREAGGLQGARLLRRRRHRHGAVLGPAGGRGRAKIGYPPARVWGVPTTALWAHKIGPTRAKRLLLTGDSIDGREAVEWGLATDWAPAAELDGAFEALLERVARLPINQLVMHKLLVNQAVAAQGLLLDPGARHLLRRDRPPHARGPRVRPPRRRERLQGGGARARRAVRRLRPRLDREAGAMRVLITSSRMPFALGMVRQLADAGHEVYAADDYAPGAGQPLEVRWPATSSTRRRASETEAFIDELERIVDEHEIDVVVPAFEEVFFLSTQRDRLSRSTTIFGAQFQAARPAARQGRVRAPRPPTSACRSPRPSSPPPTPSSPRRSSASTATSGAPCSRAAASTCSPTPARSPGVLDPADVPPDAGRAVADPAVRRGRDGLHLLDRPRRARSART